MFIQETHMLKESYQGIKSSFCNNYAVLLLGYFNSSHEILIRVIDPFSDDIKQI